MNFRVAKVRQLQLADVSKTFEILMGDSRGYKNDNTISSGSKDGNLGKQGVVVA